jgi:hypothetical protein
MSETKNIGIFKYDVFPFMVVHTIVGWDTNGDIEVDLGYPNFATFKASWLIAVFPYSKKDELEKEIDVLKTTYNKQLKEVKKTLLDSFCKKYTVIENLPVQ